MPALLSDTEGSDSEDDDDDIFDDNDDDVPWTTNLTSNVDRKEFPGCPGIMTDNEEPQDITSKEHQDSIHRIFEEISEVMEAQEIIRASKSTEPTIRTSTPTENSEQESSMIKYGEVGEQESSTTQCGDIGTECNEVVTQLKDVKKDDFDSEEDDALLKCAEPDNEAESLLDKMTGTKSIFMSSTMISYIINFPLANKLQKLNLSVKKIFTIEEENLSNIN